jgi:uncharacterized protein YjdB
MVLSAFLLVLPTASAQAVTPAGALAATEAYLVETVTAPEVGSIGGEWSVIGLARAGSSVPDGYWEGYLARVRTLVSTQGARLSTSKSTDNSRVILAFTALGRDATAIAGADLVAPLADMDWVTRQGVNGAIFALIAANSGDYEIPVDTDVVNQTTEDKLIAFILDRELGKGTAAAGGWAMSGTDPDPDITAMALQSLAPYYGQAGYADLTQAVDRALISLSGMQLADGGFAAADFAGGAPCCESNAQVIIALTALGVDPTTDARFVKAGGTPMTALLSFYQEGTGAFEHDASGGGENLMATEQAMLALASYDRLQAGEPTLYDMADASPGPATRIADIPMVGSPMTPGASVDLPARLEFADGTTGDVTWTSSAASVAGIRGGSLLTCLDEGTATLTATDVDGNGRSAEIAVTVARAVTGLRTALTKIYLVKGTKDWKPFVAADSVTNGTAGIFAKLTFSSSRPDVATVSATTGKITALKAGSTTITVQAMNGKSLSISVTVTARRTALRSFGISGLSASLRSGKTAQLKLRPGPASATNLMATFKSSNTRVATVDAAGRVKALKKGSARITVTLGGKKLVKNLTVK